ncbi:hypothetical protein RHGRI_007812 [Rhododendron griersonianum]|uniref:Uncharacterized protein n=1 Tax=Rhododendron griersonianum TaxID=479676 RepID=A0AAV6KYY0_9ERIC|nr:hypothetical protein RHGRI_007812 [Rhododendron griersonianum]
MAKDGKIVFKFGELALETRNYLEKRNKLIKENYAKIEALGCKQLANPFLKKSTTVGKRRHKMDCAVNDDEDWQPADGEDGSSSCFEDDECSLEDEQCSGGRLSKVATTRKRVQLSAGPMSAILQPLLTINQDQHGNQQVQLQEQPQPQALPPVQAKRVRCRAAPMSTILQPLPTISQDQHGNQLPPNYHEFQSPSDEGHVNERAVELESHQQSMSSHTTPNLQSLEQSNEGSRTSVGADRFHLFQRRLHEGASQIPESSESPTLREELFTNVLKPDRNGRRVKDQLRAELGVELRQEVLRDISDEITQLKNQYATMAAYMKSAGHLLPPSPNGAGNGDGDHTPSLMEHNGQILYIVLVQLSCSGHSYLKMYPTVDRCIGNMLGVLLLAAIFNAASCWFGIGKHQWIGAAVQFCVSVSVSVSVAVLI